jgi:hypothetical protein
MWLFTKTETVYVDSLHEWRKTEVLDFHLLDRVWILRTIQESEYSHPHSRWKRDIDYTAQEGIIIGTANSTLYTETPVGGQLEYEGWEYKNSRGDIMEYEWNLRYTYTRGYKVLLRDGTIVYAHTVKKSHGEFQEEFEHLQEIEKKKIEILANQERYRESLEWMEELLEKGRNLQNGMTERLIKATLPTK